MSEDEVSEMIETFKRSYVALGFTPEAAILFLKEQNIIDTNGKFIKERKDLKC